MEEILPDSEEYKAYLQMAENSVENEMVSFARFFDITILSGGQEIQPAAPVDVKIELADTLEEGAKAIHFGEEVEVIDAEVTSLPEKTTDAEAAENAGSETAFLRRRLLGLRRHRDHPGEDHHRLGRKHLQHQRHLRRGREDPCGRGAQRREILSESERYNGHVNETETVLGLEGAGSLPYARFFDITILGAEGRKSSSRGGDDR